MCAFIIASLLIQLQISKSTTSEQACLPTGRQAHEGPSGME